MLWCFEIENQKIQIVKGVYIRYMSESLYFPNSTGKQRLFSQFEGGNDAIFPN